MAVLGLSAHPLYGSRLPVPSVGPNRRGRRGGHRVVPRMRAFICLLLCAQITDDEVVEKIACDVNKWE